MTARSWLRNLFGPKARPITARPRTRARTRPAVEALEDRLAPAVDTWVVLGGTLDINPIENLIHPPAKVFPYYTLTEVLPGSAPAQRHGTMSTTAGDDFRYVNDGTGLGETETVDFRFGDAYGGPGTWTGTLAIHIVSTDDQYVALGGTLDINPVSSIFPPGGFQRMEILEGSDPGLGHGTMYKFSTIDAYPWGSGLPNPFGPPASPSFTQNVIYPGQGFRYVNDGTGLGRVEHIDVGFSSLFGYGGTMTLSYPLVIHITSADAAPKITTQPEGITMISPGQAATLSVGATGQGTLHYQWYSGITPNAINPIAGATSSTFTTPVLTVGGQYLYWVKVTSEGGVVNSLNATVQVNEQTTTTTSDPEPPTYSRASQTVTLEATVTREAAEWFGIADGAVKFTVPGVGSTSNVGFTAVSKGVVDVTAVLTIPGHTHAGVYPIEVSYAGNIPLYLGPSKASATLTIVKADQTISGFDALPEKTYGDSEFTIDGVSATSDPDAGGVTFKSLNPSVAIVSGNWVKIVGAGDAVIVASQAGNIDWNPAPDVQQTLTVHKAPPTITAVSDGGIYNAQPFDASATVVGVDSKTPVAGSFSFTYYAGSTASGTPLTGAPVNAGTYTVVAAFTSSDPNYTSGTAQTTFTISPAPTSISVGASRTSSVYGQSVTLTATVTTPAGAAIPGPGDGPVGFFDGDTLLGIAYLSGSPATATLTTAALTPGAHTIWAAYSGNNFVTSRSGVEPTSTQVVALAGGLRGLPGAAADGQGDFFFADPASSRVVEVKADGSQATVGTGLSRPTGVALDGRGDVFIDDAGLNVEWEVLAGLPVQVSPRAVTLGGSRPYDGTATADAGILSITNLVGGDQVTLSGSATLASANAGPEAISSFAGLTLGGSAAGNYTLTGASGSVTIRGSVSTSVIIDNGQPGFSETGSGWIHYTGTGYNNTVDYAAAGTGANTATWQQAGLTAGNYEAQVTWNVVSNHATNATYKVYDGNTLLGTVTVNQQLAPAGPTVNGTPFQSLGVFPVTSGTLKVVLTDAANGYVIADAARFVAAPPGVTIDNGQVGFSETGSGWTHYTGTGYNNTVDYAAAGTGSNTATWQLTGLASGTYDVQVTWNVVSNHATNATYSVYDGSTLLGTVTVNQQLAPSGPTVNGRPFQSLGLFQVTSGTLEVVLTDSANGYVIADAARFLMV